MEFSKRMDRFGESIFTVMKNRRTAVEARGQEVIDFSIGAPNIPPAPHITKVLSEEALKPENYLYAIVDLPELLEAVAQWYLRRYGVALDPKTQITSVLGSQEGLSHIGLSILNEGDVVLLPEPCYPVFADGAALAGAELHYMPLKEENDYQIDFEEMESKITDKTKMIVVVNPSNPTGGVFSRETLEKLSEIAIKHDLLVIADEIYSQLVYDGTEHVSIASLPGMKERTITLGGFSKAYSMTGWRLGYMCAPVGIIQACVRVHQYTVTCASSFVQEAALTALSDCAEDVEAMRKEYQRRKDYVVKALNEIDGISCNNPHGAFYIFVNIKSLGMTSMEVAEYLLDNAKIALVPGSAFGSEGEGYLRISYACSYEDLQEACARIKKAVEELKNK